MTVLGALVRRGGVQDSIRSTPWGDWSDTSGSTWAGVDVTTENMFTYTTVFGCNRFICDGISTLPIHVFEDVDGVRRKLPTPDHVKDPTPDLDFVSWSTQVLTSWLSAGDSFTWVEYGRGGVAAATPVDPTLVTVRRERGRKVFDINGRRYDSRQIIHVPGMMFPGADRGLSPLEAARQTIGAGMSAEEYAARFFGDDSTPPGVIEIPTEATADQLRDMARSWSKAHSGKSKRSMPGVLQGGAQWKPTAVTNEQAQFLQTRGFTASMIAAQIYLIDPVEVGLPVQGTSLTYTNQEERSIRKVQVSFLPWIVRLEGLVTRLLPAGQYAKLNVAGLLRGDTLARYQAYGIGLDKDFITVDEVRGLEDLPPLPERAAPPPSLTDQIEALGQLIRAGFDPAAALEFLGLPPIDHTGLVPITVTSDDDPKPPSPQETS